MRNSKNFNSGYPFALSVGSFIAEVEGRWHILPSTTLRYADNATSHLTRPANNADQVIGYQGERTVGITRKQNWN